MPDKYAKRVPITLNRDQMQDLIIISRMARRLLEGRKSYQEVLMVLEDQVHDHLYGRRESLRDWIDGKQRAKKKNA